MPWIVPRLLPSGYEVIAAAKQCEKCRQLDRIILQVCIHREDELAARACEADRERCRLAIVGAKSYRAVSGIARIELAQHLERTIRRAVIDKDDLPRVAGHLIENRLEARRELSQRFFLVELRDHDADDRAGYLRQ